MTIDINADVSNIDVEFTPQGGNTTRVAFNLNFLEDNLNGTRTYQVTSTTPVLLVDVTTSNYINWPEGSFISAPGYTGYVSENYNTAFNEDYNTGLDFTTTFTTGDEGSGIGTVTIVC
jgi:hypothetical protein